MVNIECKTEIKAEVIVTISNRNIYFNPLFYPCEGSSMRLPQGAREKGNYCDTKLWPRYENGIMSLYNSSDIIWKHNNIIEVVHKIPCLKLWKSGINYFCCWLCQSIIHPTLMIQFSWYPVAFTSHWTLMLPLLYSHPKMSLSLEHANLMERLHSYLICLF